MSGDTRSILDIRHGFCGATEFTVHKKHSKQQYYPQAKGTWI
jgi:hypothetical protein